ncbi:MAG TPA: aminodeoxychorismate synthase component I [Vicinamibacterales bacterium]
MDVILRTPWGGPWRKFTDPVRVITATHAADVPRALAEADAELQKGSYVAGFVTYEASAGFELPVREPHPGLPLVFFGVFDEGSVEHLRRLPEADPPSFGSWTPSIDHAAYLDAIAAIKNRIEAGDTYQINYTFRLEAPFAGEPLGAMHGLVAAQDGPWGAYVSTGQHVICSASPELFFSVDGERVTCRPMKGTSARGYWPDDDHARAEALRASPKNRAENVMIVDMVRNDLGRIARTGSVRVISLHDIERYPLQWQMTSTVEGLVPQPSLEKLFGAMFPCGSITGAPRISSMGIIRDLESTPRGVYTGAIGFASPHGQAHFNVAIRTVVFNLAAGRAEFGVGSGVVWDSVDRDEYDECLLKAEMLSGSPRPAFVGGASYITAERPGFKLLETILWTPDDGFALLDRHLSRLGASAASFGFTCDLDDVHRQLGLAVGDLRGPSRTRILLDHDGSVLCEAVDLVPLNDPLRVALAAEPIDRSDVFLYHKTTKRDVYDRARASRPEADSVLLWNDAGEVTEGTEANLVIVRDGVKVTPPIDCGLLPGTLRAELLASGQIVEGRVMKDELASADEIWLINSVRGWMRVVLVAGVDGAGGDGGA